MFFVHPPKKIPLKTKKPSDCIFDWKKKLSTANYTVYLHNKKWEKDKIFLPPIFLSLFLLLLKLYSFFQKLETENFSPKYYLLNISRKEKLQPNKPLSLPIFQDHDSKTKPQKKIYFLTVSIVLMVEVVAKQLIYV